MYGERKYCFRCAFLTKIPFAFLNSRKSLVVSFFIIPKYHLESLLASPVENPKM